MKRFITISLLILATCAVRVSAQTSAFNGFCFQGGIQSQTSGLPSSNYLLGVIPNCTVTVYLTGTTTLATIYKDTASTTLINPFKATVIGPTGAGQWLFFAPNGQAYDVVMSGGNSPLTYPKPVTLTGLGGGSGGGGSGPLIQTNGTNNVLQTLLNFQNTATMTFSNPSGGIEQGFCNTASGVGSQGCFFIPLTGTGAPSASCSISNASQNYYDINPGVTSPTVYICKLVGSSYSWQAIATGSTVYPGAGVPLSTGSAWATSYAVQGTDAKLLSSGTTSGIAGALLCLDTSAGASTSGCTVPVPVFQHNGTNLVNQSTINFNDTTPSPPAGFTNVTFQTNSGGAISAYVPTQNGFQMQQIPPQVGQFAIVYAAASANSTIGDSTANSSNIWGIMSGGPLGLGGNGQPTIVWSGFTLPSYVNPANVTSVWASATAESGAASPPTGTCLGIPYTTNTSFYQDISATGTGTGTFSLSPGGPGYPLGTATADLTGMTGANVPSITITAAMSTSGTCVGAVYGYIPQVFLYVYYTGTAPPANNNVMVQPPLQFANNTLSISSQAHFPGTSLIPTTINALPVANTSTKWIVSVTDGVSSSDCSTGGGTNYVLCQSNGSGWSAYSVSGAVSSVSNSDSSLIFSPTTGAVIGSLNVAHANTWTATQTMSGLVLSAITGSTQCLQVNTGGVVSGTGSACGSGSSGISGGVSGQAAIFGSATTITSGIALGTSGSDIPQLSGGLLNNSVINWTAPGALGTGTPNVANFTTLAASSTVTFPGIEGVGTYCVQVSATGVLSNTGAACGSGSGAVNSVSNSDSTLVFSPTTGAVVGSLNLANPNTWTGLQTFGTHISIGGVTATGATGTGNVVFSASPTLTGTLTAANLNTSGTVTMTGIEAATSTSCLQISTSGSVTNTGSSCGGASGGIPANLNQAFTGTSWNDDDGETQATPITITGWTCSAGVCTFTNSGTNAFAVGDWVNVRYLSSWFAVPSPFEIGTGYTLFQVISSGLSSTQFEFSYSSNTGSCASSCGTVESAMNNLPFAATATQGQPSTAEANTVMLLSTPVTLGGIASNFSTLFAAYNPSTTGKPLLVTISDPWNDIGLCETVATIEGYYSSIFAAAHAWTSTKVMVLSPMAKNSSQAFGAGFCTFPVAPQVEAIQIDQWLQTTANPNLAVRANGEHWDYYLDAGAVYNDAYDTGLLYGSPTAWQKLGQMYTNCLAAGGCEPLSGMRWRFGNANNTDSSPGNGYNMVPSADSIKTFQWQNASNNSAMILGTQAAGGAFQGLTVAGFGSFSTYDGGTAALRLTDALTNGDNSIATMYQSILSTGNEVNLNLGVSAATNNALQLGFDYVGAGSSSNYAWMGVYGGFSSDVLKINGTGLVTVPSLADPSLTSGNCVQASTAGLLTTTGSACGGNISGGASGEVALFGSATTITSGVQLGTSGSDIPQLSGGLLATSILPKATASAFGAVEGDGSTITLASGVISCTTATTSQLGCVKPDGTTISISGGIISALTPGLGLPTKSYTSNQTASSADNNYAVVMNCNSCSYTLPVTQPSSQWTIGLQFRGTGDSLVLASGASYNSNTNSPQIYEDQLISITANQQTTTDYIGPNLLPSSGPTYTAGASVTSCGQASGYTNTNDRGEVTIVGGTATTGTICTVNFSSTLTYAPGLCTVTQSGGTTVFSLGHGTPTTSSFTITAGISVVGSTVTADYRCTP